MLTVDRDAGVPPQHVPDLSLFGVLLEDKVWQHLGLTLDEFFEQEAEGAYAGDGRPEVKALLNLLRTGAWAVSGRTARLFSGPPLTVVPSPRNRARPVAGALSA